MWKLGVSLLLGVLILAAGFELYGVYDAYAGAEANHSELKAKLDVLKKENGELEAEVSYLNIPENLLKELRTRFNYKFPGEKSIIIVPKD